jgi:hypothetical protein
MQPVFKFSDDLGVNFHRASALLRHFLSYTETVARLTRISIAITPEERAQGGVPILLATLADYHERMIEIDEGYVENVEDVWQESQQHGLQTSFEDFTQNQPLFGTEADAWSAFVQFKLENR